MAEIKNSPESTPPVNKESHPNSKKPKQSTILILSGLIGAMISLVISLGSAFLFYNHIQNKRIAELRADITVLQSKIDSRLAVLQNAPDLNVLAEQLENLRTAQATTLATSQHVMDAITILLGVVGFLFVLVSGYFIYRQIRTDLREEDSWVLTKDILELIKASEEFVVRAKVNLEEQEKRLEEQEKRLETERVEELKFLQNKLNRFKQMAMDICLNFHRDKILTGMPFKQLSTFTTNIETYIGRLLRESSLDLDSNIHFLRGVHWYIVNVYSEADDAFKAALDFQLDPDYHNKSDKQISLIYYYKGLIAYNKGDNATAQLHFNNSLKYQGKSDDFKPRMLLAEVLFSQNNKEAVEKYDEVIYDMNLLGSNRTIIQENIRSLCLIQRAFCDILLETDYSLLPEYYNYIRNLPNKSLKNAISYLNNAQEEYFFVLISKGQFAEALGEKRHELQIKEPRSYFQKAYDLLQINRPHERREEPRAKFVAYSCLALCQNAIGLKDQAFATIELLRNDFLTNHLGYSYFSIFSKKNVAREKMQDELGKFVSASFAAVGQP